MGEIADYHVDQFTSGRWGMPNYENQRRNDKMTNQNPTRVVTGEARLSYVNLLRPRENQYGGEPKFSVTILVPKTDIATKQRIDAAIEAAKQIGKSKVWNGVIPPMVATPVYDGDGVKPSDGMPFGDECKGHWVFSASSKVDQPVKIVDVNLNPIMDPTEVYSGMYARVAVNFGPYAQAGKKGVGCYLSTNVQKTRDGEPLGASAPDASSDFGGGAPGAPSSNVYVDPNQLPFNNQPQYGQVPNQPYQQPQYQQPPAQQVYGQPVQQPYPQQQAPAQPQQQQFDPITGAPIGGVYGL